MNVYQWITLLFGSGILLEIFRRLYKKVEENTKKTEAIELGVQAILRNGLKQEYEKAIRDGYATIADKENFENMYKQYHNLGVNGVMDSIREDYLALPTEKREEV